MTADGLDIGDRMKRYEDGFARSLTRRVPVVIRVDGRAFHTLTRRLYGRGWSEAFALRMQDVVMAVASDMQGCTLAYCQSDEASFLLTDYRTIKTGAWFDYDLAKLVSISASKASAVFSGGSCFDSRAFNVPQDEVANYFLWRQIDATRNAIQMAGREHFSPKQLHLKNCNAIQEMLFQEKGINFNDYPVIRKRGFCFVEDHIDAEPPIFSADRPYIERHVYVRED